MNEEKMGISFQLEFSDYEKLQAEAKKDARTMASLLRLIVKQYLAEQTNHTQQKLF